MATESTSNMNPFSDARFLRVFFGIAACSWMPHWACHYYRLETHSNFVVGSFAFSPFESFVSLLIYSGLVALNLLAIYKDKYQLAASAMTAIGHLSIGSLHALRLVYPFTFEVFGYSWSFGSSLREALITLPFAALSSLVAVSVNARRVTGELTQDQHREG
jgi:hypothetical protein